MTLLKRCKKKTRLTDAAPRTLAEGQKGARMPVTSCRLVEPLGPKSHGLGIMSGVVVNRVDRHYDPRAPGQLEAVRQLVRLFAAPRDQGCRRVLAQRLCGGFFSWVRATSDSDV